MGGSHRRVFGGRDPWPYTYIWLIHTGECLGEGICGPIPMGGSHRRVSGGRDPWPYTYLWLTHTGYEGEGVFAVLTALWEHVCMYYSMRSIICRAASRSAR